MQTFKLTRRALLAGAAVLPALRIYAGTAAAADLVAPQLGLAAIEKHTGGRLGVAALDTGSGRRIDYRSGEPFAMCSTFKFLLVTQVLARVDAGQEQLDRVLHYGERDLLKYAPVARQHLKDGGMSVAALCEAAITYSDNTAANLLLDTQGGPPGLTRYVRTLGDPVTRLDRTEPTLNTALANDPRDTTTPAAMLRDLQTVLLGTALMPASRQRLTDWLIANTTGDARLRTGVPASWRVGDKTGTGDNGATNDIAILWPANRPPLLVAAYLTETPVPLHQRNAALAEVGRVVASYF